MGERLIYYRGTTSVLLQPSASGACLAEQRQARGARKRGTSSTPASSYHCIFAWLTIAPSRLTHSYSRPFPTTFDLPRLTIVTVTM